MKKLDIFVLSIFFLFAFILGYSLNHINLNIQEEDIIFIYNDLNKSFTLYPLDSNNESYQLPINTTINISIIRDKRYDNESFVKLIIPEGLPYKYLRGFVSSRLNKTLVLSWR
jgi:hypothetical protein